MTRYHVSIDGQGFLVRPGSYTRAVQAESGWKGWEQGDWRRGDGQVAQAQAGRWRTGYGVDVGTAGRVSLGRRWRAAE